MPAFLGARMGVRTIAYECNGPNPPNENTATLKVSNKLQFQAAMFRFGEP
jgi:hypothetical protein